jgi:hypothetical protein
MAKPPCRGRFWHGNVPFSTKTNTVDTVDDKVDDDINKFYFFYFLDFLAASNSMVADEGGVRRSICAVCTILNLI